MGLTAESIARFRQGYVAEFGAAAPDDLLYHSVSEGRRYVGMEHWLPLFADGLETLFDHLPDVPVALDHLVDEAIGERLDQIKDHYQARRQAMEAGIVGGGAPYKPLPPDRLYLDRHAWSDRLQERAATHLRPSPVREAADGRRYGRAHRAQLRRRADRRRRQRLRRGRQARRALPSSPASASSSPAGARAPATAWARCWSITA